MVGHLPVVRCLPTVACSGKLKTQKILEYHSQWLVKHVNTSFYHFSKSWCNCIFWWPLLY